MSTRKETKVVITKRGNVEINRTEVTEEFICCDDCGKKLGHYHQFGDQCGICGKDLCGDHKIHTVPINGVGVCAACNKIYAEEIHAIGVNAAAAQKALHTISKTREVYERLSDALIQRHTEATKRQ